MVEPICRRYWSKVGIVNYKGVPRGQVLLNSRAERRSASAVDGCEEIGKDAVK